MLSAGQAEQKSLAESCHLGADSQVKRQILLCSNTEKDQALIWLLWYVDISRTVEIWDGKHFLEERT